MGRASGSRTKERGVSLLLVIAIWLLLTVLGIRLIGRAMDEGAGMDNECTGDDL